MDRIGEAAAGVLLLLLLSLHASFAADYAIQPEDVLSVQVTGEAALSKDYTVDERGDITVESVGKVHVAGLSAAAVEEVITKQLGKYLKLFEVSVSIKNETGGRVLVFGEVAKPGSYRVRSGARLLDVLAEAGQPTPGADTKRIAIIRKEGGTIETRDLDAVLKDSSLNIEISPGDTITVPSRIGYSIQVDGEVQTPGLRSLEMFQTAYAAIMSAGPLPSADWKRIAMRRKGSTIPLMVDLSPVRAGKISDDIELREGDQLTVMSRYRGTATLRGEVKEPGEKPLVGPTQLGDFIRAAGGGFTEIADPANIDVLREGEPARKVDLEEVASGRKSSDDPAFEVLPGDVIFIPNDEKRRFAIIGGVKMPGAHPVKPGMTFLDAIFIAGGFTPTASLKQFVLAPADPKDDRFAAAPSSESEKPARRRATADKDQEALLRNGMVLLDYKKIASGELSVPLRPGDRILIPENFPSQRKPSLLDQTLRLVPLASLFLIGSRY